MSQLAFQWTAPTGRNTIAQGFNPGENRAYNSPALKGRNTAISRTFRYALSVLDLFLHPVPRVRTLGYCVTPLWG